MAVRDSDYAAFAWYPALPELDRWMELYQEAARANGGEPDAGRRLLSWARAAGFTDVTPSAGVWCFADPEDRAYWGGMWADRILTSALATQLIDEGRATTEELRLISEAWAEWRDRSRWLAHRPARRAPRPPLTLTRREVVTGQRAGSSASVLRIRSPRRRRGRLEAFGPVVADAPGT